MGTDIRKRILELENLPSPPALAAELIELTSREDVRIAQIAALIERDPALTSKLLRHCNSAAYGLRHKVSSIERATVMLGIRQIKCLALGFVILTQSDMMRPKGFDFSHYWTRASVTAVSSRLLANQVLRAMAGEAFVAGLLQDIGVLLLEYIAPREYNAVAGAYACGGRRLHEIEETVLGVNHLEAGQAMLRGWGLPDLICDSVAFHHYPQLYEGDRSIEEVIEVVAAASEITNLFCEPHKGGSLERVLRVCAGFFHLREEHVHDLLATVADHVQESTWLFEIYDSKTLDYEQIRKEAQEELQALGRATVSDAAVS